MKFFFLPWCLALVLVAGQTRGATNLDLVGTNLPSVGDPAAKVFHTEPAPDDAHIAALTGRILSRSHYRQQPFNEEISEKFYDQFLEMLDPLRLYFFQSDMQGFDKYRKVLDKLTVIAQDTRPAHRIFECYVQRLDQQAAFVKGALKTNQFVFDTNEMFDLSRRKQPRPQNLAEAHKLWWDRLRFEYLQEKLNKEKPEEIVKKITRRYTNTQRYIKEYDGSDVLQYYLTSLAHAYDPHSEYMGRAKADNFSISMKLSLFGIGALLQWDDGYCKIRSLVPGGPAEKCKKLHPNDRIIAVAQGEQEPVDILDMKLDKAVELIRGPKGTEVRLTIIPASATDPSVRKIVTLIRDEIPMEESEAKARVIDLPGPEKQRLGLIDLPSFYFEMPTEKKMTGLKSTTADVSRLIEKLKKEHVRGIILDLRRNGGGSLEEAIRLTGLFIKSGPVVQVRDSEGQTAIKSDPDPSIQYDGPLLVMTSRGSASASEILAGALQDYDRALIVGDISTHGKGTVQQLVPLEPIMRQVGISVTNDPGTLKLTIGKFYRASGASTQLKGITPDIVLPSVANFAEGGEGSLSNALSWDTIASAKYEPMGMVRKWVPEMKRRSDTRVATNADFTYLSGEIERFKKMLAEKTVSLNENKRRKEKDDATTRTEARKKVLKARPDSGEKVYEITLKQVDLPGLPPPMAKTNTVAAADAEAKVVDPDDPTAIAEDEEVPEVDMDLNESKSILCDLIQLSSANSLVGKPAAVVPAENPGHSTAEVPRH